jgi:hypothetical protein
MSTHHAPRPCFTAGYYFESANQFFIVFSEGEIYAYTSVLKAQWLELRDHVNRGVYFNAYLRRPNRTTGQYQRVRQLPKGWSDSFSI